MLFTDNLKCLVFSELYFRKKVQYLWLVSKKDYFTQDSSVIIHMCSPSKISGRRQNKFTYVKISKTELEYQDTTKMWGEPVASLRRETWYVYCYTCFLQHENTTLYNFRRMNQTHFNRGNTSIMIDKWMNHTISKTLQRFV